MIRRLLRPKKEDLRVIGFVACLHFHPHILITGHGILQCNMFLLDLTRCLFQFSASSPFLQILLVDFLFLGRPTIQAS